METGLDGHGALVTAGSAGLGLASAEALAREGANVAVCGRTEERLAQARERLGEYDVEARAVQADITDRDDVESFVEETAEAFGRLDHVVTSAGGPPSGAFLDTSDRDWYDAYDLLVMSVVWTTKAAHPYLEESPAGTIVNITSKSVKEVIDGLVLSNSVRRTVIGLMKTQAREFAPEVRVNAVLPGTHETDRIRDLARQSHERGEYDSFEEALEARGEGIPLERIGDPVELGEAVTYLSSGASSFVTGETLVVDGGATQS
jgi:NAD(P)-dependent dehydrogenase (short-subunit alcohol dehydrogenase family)